MVRNGFIFGLSGTLVKHDYAMFGRISQEKTSGMHYIFFTGNSHVHVMCILAIQ